MGRKTRKGTKGVAAQHLTRGSALKKLQLSLADFRRLCILKGIYPRDPKKKPKGRDKTYYHAKDVLYLYHEPLLGRFRDLKAHDKKVKRALGRGEKSIARGLVKRKPVYALFHIIKERYPTLLDCLRDLDDALCSLALFASLPTDDEKDVTADVVADATRLFDEFLLFAAQQRLVRKVFCSIKGFYIQIRYLGQNITFLIPHQFPQDLPSDVDFKVMLTFLDFYLCMVKCVNFKIYQMEGLAYPPSASHQMLRSGCRYLSLTTDRIGAVGNTTVHQKDICDAVEVRVEDPEVEASKNCLAETLEKLRTKLDSNEESEEEVESESDGEGEFGQDGVTEQMKQLSDSEKAVQSLFKERVFFISREVPRLPIAFLLQSCGASLVGWQDEHSPIEESDERITHHILDRPVTDDLMHYEIKREFIQPQWIFDSINNAVCLPVSPYKSGVPPPPHLSPFVDDSKEGYVPEQRIVLQQLADDLKRTELTAQHGDEEVESEEENNDQDAEIDIEDVEHKEEKYQQDIMEETRALGSSKEKVIESEKLRRLKNEKKSKEEEKERRKALLSKKHKRLLERIEYGKQKSSDKVAKLRAKRSTAISSK